MSDEISLGLSLPLDSDGFLRRQCPTCGREFKVVPAREGEEPVPVPDGGYFCPYCGVQAPPEDWWTNAQRELVRQTALSKVVGPMLDDFADDMERLNRPGSFIRVKVDKPDISPPERLSETDDMVLVEFPCHSSEPVKVLEEWAHSLCCPACGQQLSK